MKPRPAGKVLAEIKNENARLWLGELDGFQNARHPNRRRVLCVHRPELRFRGKFNSVPLRVVKARAIPAGQFAPRIVNFAEINTVPQNRSLGSAPAFIGANGLRRAVGEFHDKLQHRARLAGDQRVVGPDAHPQREWQRIEPSVTEHDADGILSALKLLGDVVSGIQNAFGVARPAGIQHVVAHAFAIQPQFKIAGAADVSAGGFDFFVELKLFAKQRSRVVVKSLGLRDA